MANRIVVSDAIMIYPSLFTKKEPMQAGMGSSKYTAKFLLHKRNNTSQIKSLLAFEQKVIRESLGSQAKLGDKNKFLMNGSLCMDKDGNPKEKFSDYYVFNASNAQRRPIVVHEDSKTVLESQDEIPAGSKVNIQIEIYVLNKNGKRTCATLRMVQRAWFNDESDNEINRLVSNEDIEETSSIFGVINNGVSNAPFRDKPFNDDHHNNDIEADIPF